MKNKSIWWWAGLGALVIVLAIVTTALLVLPKEKINVTELSVTQVENQQNITVSWETDIVPDSVTIKVVKSNGKVESSTVISDNYHIAKGQATVYASYGQNRVTVEARKGSSVSTQNKTVDVSTDEYVIAPLVATMPVTLFTLQLKEISNNFTIPTFVWLQRGAAWDYSQMPENVYLVPTGDYEKMAQYNDAGNLYIQTSLWVKELYQINNASKFHIYCNDYHPYVWMQATVANRIPAQNYDVTLMTDGTATNIAFNKYLAGNDAKEKYDAMLEEYREFKQAVWDKGDCTTFDTTGMPFTTTDTRYYLLQMLNEETNVKYIVTSTLPTSQNQEIADNVQQLTTDGKITKVSMKDLLNAFSEEEKTELKKLYRFNDNVFEKATSLNKKVMLIMGTRTANEVEFDNYVLATKAYYGDGYVYYYKGHPGTPTQADPAKEKHLQEIGLIDVDSNIAAELIFFFNPDIESSGYNSSTFSSLTDAQTGGVWNNSFTINGNFDFSINKLSKSNETYGSLATDNSFILLFRDTTNYDLAIYDVKTNSIKYYKNIDGQFTEVNK